MTVAVVSDLEATAVSFLVCFLLVSIYSDWGVPCLYLDSAVSYVSACTLFQYGTVVSLVFSVSFRPALRNGFLSQGICS